MTHTQKELIENIKKYGGSIVVCNYGIYTRFGRYLAFASLNNNKQHSTESRNFFLKNFVYHFQKMNQMQL